MKALLIVLLGLLSFAYSEECTGMTCETGNKIESTLRELVSEIHNGVNEYSKVAAAAFGDLVVKVGESSQIKVHWEGKLTQEAADDLLKMLAHQLELLKKLGSLSEEAVAKALAEAKEGLAKKIGTEEFTEDDFYNLVAAFGITNGDLTVKVGEKSEIKAHWEGKLTKAGAEDIFNMISKQVALLQKIGLVTEEVAKQVLADAKAQLDKALSEGKDLTLGNEVTSNGDLEVKIGEHSTIKVHWTGKLTADGADRMYKLVARQLEFMKKLKIVTDEEAVKILADTRAKLDKLIGTEDSLADAMFGDLTVKIGEASQIKIHWDGDLTQEKADGLLEMLKHQIEVFKKMGILTAEEAEKTLTQAKEQLEKLIKHAAELYGITGSLDEIVAKVKEVIANLVTILKTVAGKLLDRVEAEWKKYAGKIGFVMKIIGKEEEWKVIKAKIEGVLHKIRVVIEKKIAVKAETLLTEMSESVVNSFQDIESDQVINDGQYSLESVWGKIREVVKQWIAKLKELKTKMLGEYKEYITKMIKKVLAMVKSKMGPLIKKIVDELRKLIKGTASVVAAMNTEEEREEAMLAFSDVWKQMMDKLRSLGKVGTIVADICDHYKAQVIKIVKKIASTGLGGLEKIVADIRDDIIKIIQGGHMEYDMENGVKEVIEAIIQKIRSLGKVGEIIAKIAESLRGKIGEIMKKVSERGLEGLIKIIKSLKDDIIKIVQGGHITYDENGFEDGWKTLMDKLRATGKVGTVVANILDHYKDQVIKIVKKIASTGLGGLEKIVADIRDDIIKIIQGGHITYSDLEEMVFSFESVWKMLMDKLRASGKVGAIAAKILDNYAQKLYDVVKKIASKGLSGIVKIIEEIKDDIIRIVKGGHMTYDANGFEEGWKAVMDKLRASGKVGTIVANILDHYKDQVIKIVKKIASTGLGGLEKIVADIRDDIIKIIQGGHITYSDLEEASNSLESVWKSIIEKLKGLGKGGQMVAKLLDSYVPKIVDAVKNIVKKTGDMVVKIIKDIEADLIKIVQGGHITYDANTFDETWTKMMDSLRKLGKVGDIVAKILDHYKDQLVKIVKKIASTGLGGLEKIVADIRDDIIKIIQGGHITYSDLEEMTFSIESVWKMIMEKLRASGKVGAIVAKILDNYAQKLYDVVKKIASKGLSGIVKIIEEIKDDIIRIVKGGHITYDANGFEEGWKAVMDKLRASGKVGTIVANILDHYKDQVIKIVKKIASTGLGGLEKIVADIRDDIIKIIQGGHITYSDLEEASNSLESVWKSIIEKLKGLGKGGQMVAKLLDSYVPKIVAAVKNIVKKTGDMVVKIIKDIEADLIKIVQGGHITYDANTFDETWGKVMDSLRKLGKVGDIVAKILDHYKDQLVKIVKKIASTGLGGLEKIVADIRDDIIKIIQGEHITYFDMETSNDLESVWKTLMDKLKAQGVLGKLAAALLDRYAKMAVETVKRIAVRGYEIYEKLIKGIVDEIKRDLVKIVQGGHITYNANTLEEVWKTILDKVRSLGKGGELAAKFLETYGPKVQAAVKSIVSKTGAEVIKIIEDIKDDLIKIVKGEHLTYTDLQENSLDSVWKSILDKVRSWGKGGELAAKFLETYGPKVQAAVKSIVSKTGAEVIKIIEDIKDDLIKIVKGEHLTYDNERHIRTVWDKIVERLRRFAKSLGIIFSDSLDAMKNRIEIYINKIYDSATNEMWDIFCDVIEDIARVIGGLHVKAPTPPPDMLY